MYLLIAGGTLAAAGEPNGTGGFKQEELDQLLAPIALYPDSLLAQIFMASTYPLEVVQADRWVKDNNGLQGDALAAALENKNWDPSVKSLVNFPDVLGTMSSKFDWTQKMGDAFLSQQKDVMDTVQKLRKKAQEQGNLKTSEQQVVKDDQQSIVIESADSNGTYIPYYDPYSVYGGWWWPAYPPYYWHLRDDLVRPTPYSLRDRVQNGPAWGYAKGGCNWRNGTVDIDASRNLNLNQRINRDSLTRNYQKTGQLDQNGRGTWQHNPDDRKGVAYRDQATAQRYNRTSAAEAVQSREAYRGRTEPGRQIPGRDGTGQVRIEPTRQVPDRVGTEQGRQDISAGEVIQRRQNIDSARANRPDNRQVSAQRPQVDQRPASRNMSNRGDAFGGINNGSAARNYSNRGQMSRQSMPSAQPQMRMSPGGGGMRGGGGRR